VVEGWYKHDEFMCSTRYWVTFFNWYYNYKKIKLTLTNIMMAPHMIVFEMLLKI